MSADRALFLLNEMIWTALVVAGPLLGATLLVGLIISIVQVATQIQEITLSYVPKLLVAAIMLLVLGGWMLATLNQFALRTYSLIPSLGQ